MKTEVIDIGIIGGSGFCTFSEIKEKKLVDISVGQELPSDKITVGTYGGKTIAFLPRHGYQHQLAPHAIPYKANLIALKKLGVKYLFAFCVAGSLKKKIKPGDLVVFDQFVNLTWGRDVVFKRGQPFVHLPMADPYSNLLRKIVYREGKKIGLNMHKKGTVAVIQGPRFNTRAESQWFTHFGWDAVNMTQYPECYFAKELGIEYSGIAAITDYDVALQNYGLSMTKQKITENSLIFRKNIDKSKKLLREILINWDKNNNNFQEKSIKPQTYY